jgi:amidophosphoribosyltransferase
MCGIFGFITGDGSGPDLDRLRRIAAVTQRRGPHAFGLAWLGPDARLHTFKRPGPATANLGDLDACRGATVVIGHCRWATHGAPADNRNNHPHPAGRGFLVHNGVVENYAKLVRRFRLAPKTQCDSEVLGLLIARTPGRLVRRAARMAELAEGRLAVLGVWKDPARLLIVRNGNPLHFGQTRGGFYFASLPEGLPGKVVAIRAAYSGVLTYHGGELRHEAFSIGK